jgi:hypothetical protein
MHGAFVALLCNTVVSYAIEFFLWYQKNDKTKDISQTMFCTLSSQLMNDEEQKTPYGVFFIDLESPSVPRLIKANPSLKALVRERV